MAESTSDLQIEEISGGGVTSPQGFLAGATYAGIKKKGDNVLDLAILSSQARCTAAAVFTMSEIQAAPVQVSWNHLDEREVTAIVANSGCANACTGQKGIDDAWEMCNLVAEGLSLLPHQVLVASTGVIGVPLPMEKIEESLEKIVISEKGGHDFARAIMTTDTFAKEIALSVKVGGASFTIAGAAKGAGMIHPDLATMLCFITTDAAVRPGFMWNALRKAADASFNMISVDGDGSPNDSIFLLANGMAGNDEIRNGSPLARAFEQALQEVCLYLAKSIARDGEGATKLIEVQVAGARTVWDAQRAARCIASSSLVKAAMHGNDPNWGRIMAALGRSRATVEESRVELRLNGVVVFRRGEPQPFNEQELSHELDDTRVNIVLDLHLGKAKATAWGCDLSEEYVTINSDYTT